MSRRVSFDVLADALICSPVHDSKPGSFETSLQTSFINSTDTSPISLCRVKPNLPFCKKMNVGGCNFDPHTQVVGKRGSAQLYLFRSASQNCCLFKVEVKSTNYMIKVFDLVLLFFVVHYSCFL